MHLPTPDMVSKATAKQMGVEIVAIPSEGTDLPLKF
jgi:hypothetical protein